MFAIPSVPAAAVCPRLTAAQVPALTRDEERIAGAVLLVGIGTGVVEIEEVAEARDSDYAAYALGRLAGAVSSRMQARAAAEAREGVGFAMTGVESYHVGVSAWAGPRWWLLQAGERAITLENAARLPAPLIEQLQLALTLIDRLLLPFLWPRDVGQAWAIEELANEWDEIAERCGSKDPEVVAAWFASEGEAAGLEVYHFDASCVESCSWAATVSALRQGPAAESPIAPLYAMNHRMSPWFALARLEALTGRSDEPSCEHAELARWCADVARAVRWHTGGARGASRMRRIERRCGYAEADEYGTEGIVPICEGTVLVLGRAGEDELVQQFYERRMEAGEEPATVMQIADPLAGGVVLYHRLRGAMIGGTLLDRLGNVIAG